MSGHASSKRRRKVKREMIKDEIRCCVDAFGDYIDIAERRNRFTSQKYNRPTKSHGETLNPWRTE
ncbi:MAG: hypothetical protein ACFFDR_02735 [Candidatus Thorarchaeota archaeon]